MRGEKTYWLVVWALVLASLAMLVYDAVITFLWS
jgi:hypothetical protein